MVTIFCFLLQKRYPVGVADCSLVVFVGREVENPQKCLIELHRLNKREWTRNILQSPGLKNKETQGP